MSNQIHPDRLRRLRRATLPLVVAAALVGCTTVPLGSTGQARAPQVAAGQAEVVPQAIAAGLVRGRVMAFDRVTRKFTPLAGASVRIEGTQHRATTDADGGYSVSGLEPGEYKVVAEKDGMVGQPAAIQVNAVMGLERVDLAVAERAPYGLKAGLGVSSLAVFGVIRDPRGCAVPNATMYVTTTSGEINLVNDDDEEVDIFPGASETQSAVEAGNTARVVTTTGFYSFEAVNAADYVRFTASVFGATRGGIPLERTGAAFAIDRNDTGVATKDADGQTITLAPGQFDVQLNRFVGTVAPVGFPPYSLGENGAEIRVTKGLSKRTDEFFVRLVQGTERYDVVPITVRDSDASTDEFDTVVFRVPATLSTTQNFTASIVQLGLQASPASLPLNIGSMDLQTFKDIVQLQRSGVVQQPSLRQITDPNAVTNRFFTDEERVQFRLPLRNSRTFDVNVVASFVLDGASNITARFGAKTFTPSYDVATKTVSVPLTIPARTSGSDLIVEFTVSGLANNVTFRAEGIKIVEPRRELEILDYADTSAITVRAFDPTDWELQKVIADDGTPNNGRGLVRVRVVPPANYVGPQGIFRIFDVTENGGAGMSGNRPTDPFILGNSAIDPIGTGTVTLPTTADADRTAVFTVGLPGGLDVDRSVVFRSGAVDLAAVQADVDAVLGPDYITVTQPAPALKLRFALVNGGNKIGLKSAGSALALLGLTAPIPASTAGATRSGGATATIIGATTNLSGWTVRPSSADVELDGVSDLGQLAPGTDLTLRKGAQIGRQEAEGKTAIAFEVVPSPGAAPITNANPLIITYRVVADATTNVTLGDGTPEFGRAALTHYSYLSPTSSFRAIDFLVAPDLSVVFSGATSVGSVVGI